MKTRNPIVQAVLLIALAAVIAVVANAFASRTRQLKLPGYYPGALKVPPRDPVRVPPPPRTETVATDTVATETTATVATATTATIAPIATATVNTATSATPTPTPTTTTAPKPTPAPPPALKIDVAKFKPHPDQAYIEISGDEVAALYNAGALFLDARRSSVFEEGHIANARSFSVWESDVDDKVNKLYEERSDPAEMNKPIVIYCSGGACEDSHMLAQKLWGITFNNVYVYKDGFPDWQKRGGAVKKGAQP